MSVALKIVHYYPINVLDYSESDGEGVGLQWIFLAEVRGLTLNVSPFLWAGSWTLM